MADHITRRSFVAASTAVLLAAGTGIRPALARQAATPANGGGPFAGAGLAELTVTATDAGLALSASSIAAGRYAVTFENRSGVELWAAFMLLPDGSTVDELNDALAAAVAGHAPPPDWYYTATAPGGLSAQPGRAAHFVVDLPPGAYALHPDTPIAGIGAVPLTVTGDVPADPPDIVADVTIDMVEMAFRIDGALASGPQVVAFVNAGAQPHHAGIFAVPDGTTIEAWEATVAGMMQGPGATPVAGALAFSDLVSVVATSIQSPGTTVWAAVDLEPATLLLLCSVRDVETGAPHAAMGMAEIVVIS